MVAAEWETWRNVATGVGALLTGLAATFGVSTAYSRFLRSHESRVNLSIELTPRWFVLDGVHAVAVRADVDNDGGRKVMMLAEGSSVDQLSSRIGLFVLGSTPPVAERSVRFIHWAEHPGCGARLLDHDTELAAGDTWHADFAFVLQEDVRLALVSIQLQVRERRGWWRRREPPIQVVTTDVVTGLEEARSDGTAKASDAGFGGVGARDAPRRVSSKT
jgi:hypothetical protein